MRGKEIKAIGHLHLALFQKRQTLGRSGHACPCQDGIGGGARKMPIHPPGGQAVGGQMFHPVGARADLAGVIARIQRGKGRSLACRGGMDNHMAYIPTEKLSIGISQVNEAVAQLDSVTQQNAALVEESTSAAESLRLSAKTLERSVDVFNL